VPLTHVTSGGRVAWPCLKWGRRMRFLVLVLVLLGLTACEDTFSVDRPNQISQYMHRSATGYVSVPPDGEFGQMTFPGSGMTVSEAVMAAFAKHLSKVVIAKAPQTLDSALKNAREAGAQYLIAPNIVRWEDWNTEVSGRSDRMSVEISVIKVATGAVIEHGVISGINGVPELGSTKPEQLIPTPLSRYVDSLFPQFAEKSASH